LLKSPVDALQVEGRRIELPAEPLQSLFPLGVVRVLEYLQQLGVAPDAAAVLGWGGARPATQMG
jgi:hypothetical protein